MNLTGRLLRTSHYTLANAMNHILETSWGIWTASGEHEDFSTRHPQRCGFLQQTMSDLVSEIAEIIEHCLFGGVQPPDGTSHCIAGAIVQRFAAGDDAATIAQALLDKFPGAFHGQCAADLVAGAIKAIQTVRPGWKRLVSTSGDENLPSSDNPTPSSDNPTPSSDNPTPSSDNPTPSSVDSPVSAESTIPRIPVSELFSDSGGASLREAADHRPSVDINPTDNHPVDIALLGIELSAGNTERLGKEPCFKPAHATRAKSAMRLFDQPHLRRFVPAA